MDPRIGGPGLGQRDTSVRAQMVKMKGEQKNLNLCPCGCPDTALNEHGYCDHLVGWTMDGEVIELREFNCVSIAREMTSEGHIKERPLPWMVDERVGAKTEPVRKDDILVDCGTHNKRVYRGPHVFKPETPTVESLMKLVEYQGMRLKELEKDLGKEEEPAIVQAAG